MTVSQDVQKNIQEFAMLQQQLKLVLAQKYQSEAQLAETENAIGEINKAEKPEIHKILGAILLKAKKETVLSELSERKESLEMRLKNAETQEKKLSEKIKPLQDRLQGVL